MTITRMHRVARRTTLMLMLMLLLLVAANDPSRAEIGPCRPDAHEGLVCGEGNGAARVIEDTTSPSKRLAFAWRTPGSPLDEDPSEIETVLLRLSDGAILAKLKGEYWNTGTVHANRLSEAAAWSPDGRFVIESYHDRYDTLVLGLYAVGATDRVDGSLDLLKIVSPAARAALKKQRKTVKAEGYSLYVSTPPLLTIDNAGRIRIEASLYYPKSDPVIELKIVLQVVQRNGRLSARVVSIRPFKS